MTRARAVALVLAAWTAFVWITRLVNLAGDDDVGPVRLVWRGAFAVSFLLLAAAVARAALVRPGRLAAAVGVLAAWTVVVWAVRVVGIALGGHSAAFVAVHLGLAAVSVVLAVAATGAAARAAEGYAAPAPGR